MFRVSSTRPRDTRGSGQNHSDISLSVLMLPAIAMFIRPIRHFSVTMIDGPVLDMPRARRAHRGSFRHQGPKTCRELFEDTTNR